MATTGTNTHAPPPYQEKQHPFPQELPPRKFTQTWWQRNGFKAKTFFSLHYHSYSLRNRRGSRETWRRISMWLIMISRLAQVIFIAGLYLGGGLYLNATAITVIVFVMLIAVLLLMFTTWCVALIGDVTGTRRAVGITVRRNGLDVFLYVMAFLHVGVTATCWIWAFYGIILGPVNFFLGLILLIVALMASKEPADQYGTGV